METSNVRRIQYITCQWYIVPCLEQPQFNIIGNKWIFRLKWDPDSFITRYKARLVAKGFHQRPGIDYTETYSPVIKPPTIKLVLYIALSNGWPLCQMDVNNAFLHGSISKDIYMSQPSGFANSHFPDYVCKLRKALYGLKQAPRAWYNALKNFLITYEFLNSRSDYIFVFNWDSVVAYFLVYIEDLLLTGNNDSFLNAFKTTLALKFSLRDLESPRHFLGMEILPTSHNFFLS